MGLIRWYWEITPLTSDVSINPCPALVADIPFIIPSGLVARDKPAEHADYQYRLTPRGGNACERNLNLLRQQGQYTPFHVMKIAQVLQYFLPSS